MQPTTNQRLLTDPELREIIEVGNEDPAWFIEEALGATPWALQRDIVDAIFKYPTVAVKSCNAAGKSYICARIALAFLTLKPGSIVITTAPTWRQVKDVLWREIRTAIKMSVFKLTDAQATQVGLDISEDWFAVGLSTKDAEKFFGYHADDILVIVDEASGVEEQIFVGVDAVTPNLNAHVLMIGNPTNPDGRFFRSFQDVMVKQFTISAFDTPNFTANGIRTLEDLIALFEPPDDADPIEHIVNVQKKLATPYPALIIPMTVYRRYLEWGTDSPMWQALVMGEFPAQAEHALIPLSLILKSIEVKKQMDDPEYKGISEWNVEKLGQEQVEYGLDVARFGSDRTVLTERFGGYIARQEDWAKLDTQETADRVIDLTNPYEHWAVKVDDTGVGGGVTDRLVHTANDNPLYNFRTVAVNFGQATTNKAKFFNFRAEMFWELAEMFKQHKIAMIDNMDLANELASIRYELTADKKIKIEEKEQTKKRLRRSPDRADSLALAIIKSSVGRYTSDKSPEDQAIDKFLNRNQGIAPVTKGLGNW